MIIQVTEKKKIRSMKGRISNFLKVQINLYCLCLYPFACDIEAYLLQKYVMRRERASICVSCETYAT